MLTPGKLKDIVTYMRSWANFDDDDGMGLFGTEDGWHFTLTAYNSVRVVARLYPDDMLRGAIFREDLVFTREVQL